MDDQELLREAIGFDGAAQQALLRGDMARSRTLFRAAAERYRASWEAAGPRAFGRLIGLLKSSILWGEGGHAAGYVRSQLGDACDSPPACYALALAALVQGDDEAALPAVERMREGGEPFERTADALHALAHGDRDAYSAAVETIVADFAAREDHLTGVAFADTAVMLERLAASRGMAARPASSVMPVLG
ncbi:MAG TPA: hypothetical protein VFF79_13350 [Conexibacter sp.]|jgi:hypothetical protein|nr:hypothetical protein [Conexibacter sp.]